MSGNDVESYTRPSFGQLLTYGIWLSIPHVVGIVAEWHFGFPLSVVVAGGLGTWIGGRIVYDLQEDG